nr:DMT family transporter [Natronocella acetinitrilica]
MFAVVVVLWGINWPIMKVALEMVSPLTFVSLRLLSGLLSVMVIAYLLGDLRLPHRRDWPMVIVVGVLQMAGYLALVSMALQTVPAGRSAILGYTMSVWVAPMSVLILGETLGYLRALGVAAGLLGVLVMLSPWGFDWSTPGMVAGHLMLLLGALGWALAIVMVRARGQKGSPLALAPWQFLAGLICIVPLTLWFEGWQPVPWQHAGFIAILIYNGPITAGFGFWAMLTVTRYLPAVTTSVGALGVPAVGLVAASLSLGETITLNSLAGLGLIVLGVYLVATAGLREHRRRFSSPSD